MTNKEIRRYAKITAAQKSFWHFQKALYPNFFTDDKAHLKTLSDTLQAIYEGKVKDADGNPIKRVMVNMPPRHGKSFSLINFAAWVLGKSQSNRVIAVSYNSSLAGRFSKGVRDTIDTENLEFKKIGMNDIFPNVNIKYGDSSNSMWSLEGQHFNYLGTGMGGTITGIGCNIGIIDDPIKNDKEAFNDRILEEHWKFYTDTFLSRLEQGSIQIINMTRWATKDLCGKILETEADRWHILKMEAYKDGEMLCPELLSYEDYADKKSKTSPAIFGANYMQNPVDEMGRMYKDFKTYSELPEGQRFNYTDTADTGSDYLCSINYLVNNDQIYILDVLYTKKSMEYTEPAVAKMLEKDGIQRAKIEANNGGRGFARNVKRLLSNNFTVIKTFTQTKNKKSRIWSNSYWIEENVFYPEGWGNMWGEFYASMKNYKREGTNNHDDAQDCITGCAEQVNKPKRIFK